MIVIWHLNIFSQPEQVGREIVLRWTHLGGKCTKFTMKCDSTLYIHDWFLFKNPCNLYPLFQWENSRWLAWGHVAICVRTRHCHITTNLIHYLILPGTLKIQITENSFWVQGPTFKNPPFRASPEPLNHRGQWVWVLLWQQICGPLKATESPDTHWVSSKSLCFWLEICGVSADSAGWGLKTVLNSAASPEVLSRSCLWSNGENWDVHDPPSKSTAQYNWWLNLGKTLAYTSQIIIQNVTQGSKMEEMCMQRGGRCAQPLCPSEHSTFTSASCFQKHTSSLSPV